MSAQKGIIIHTDPADFEGMRKAGKLAAEVLDAMAAQVRPGVTTNALNDMCHAMILDAGAIPAPLNYRGFPKSVCTSVNNVICHGIPDDRKLKDGDIVNIDVTVIVEGWHGDTNRTYWAGDAPIKAKRLTQVAYEAMMLGIAQVRPGNHLGDIGHAIQTHAEKHNYSVVRDYCGHGIGKVFHDAPNVLHYGKPGTGIELRQGMFFTVEPMINAGSFETKLSDKDGWTVTTRDRALSAQFEHTVAVTADGYEIFTLTRAEWPHPPFAAMKQAGLNNSETKTAESEKPHHLGHRQRLRERFLAGGAKAVADYELIEMVLYAASPRTDTKPLAKKLLAHFGSFAKLAQATPIELAKVEGMGEAAIAAVKVIHASAERLLKEEASQGPVIQSWTALLDYCRVSMGHKKIEEFRILFLNHRHALIADEVQQTGTVNHAPVYPREVVKRALDLNASAIILAHNHPGGDPTPSKDDIQITKQIVTAAASLGLSVHDHLIIAGNKYYSFKSNGLL